MTEDFKQEEIDLREWCSYGYSLELQDLSKFNLLIQVLTKFPYMCYTRILP